MKSKKYFLLKVMPYLFGELDRDVGENFIVETSDCPITTEFLS